MTKKENKQTAESVFLALGFDKYGSDFFTKDVKNEEATALFSEMSKSLEALPKDERKRVRGEIKRDENTDRVVFSFSIIEPIVNEYGETRDAEDFAINAKMMFYFMLVMIAWCVIYGLAIKFFS